MAKATTSRTPMAFQGHQINANRGCRDIVVNMASSCDSRKRPLNITCREDLKAKIPDIQINGHPDMFFLPIYSMASDAKGFRRSLDVCPVEGGGLLVQSSWNEDGVPAQDFFYDARLSLVARSYCDEDGHEKIGLVIVKRSVWRSFSRFIGRVIRGRTWGQCGP